QCPKCNAAMGIPAQGTAAAATVPSADSAAGFALKGEQAPATASLPAGPYVPVKLDVKTMLSQTVALLKANLVKSVVGVLIALCLSALLSLVISLGAGFLASMFEMESLAAIVATPLDLVATAWVKVGAIRFFIDIVRGGPASYGLLFSGGRGFTAFFSTGIVLAIMCWIGLALFIVPGVLIGLMLWPSVFLAVDRDIDLMRAYRGARMLTKGNLLASFILFVVGYLVVAVSILACGVGVLFGMAFAALLFTLMYQTLLVGGSAEATA
ncbi:MAG: hypothetical protein KDA63_12050, partial [Planctomycetales bacterium]|nr:hypothetical protein [Planctomycetales bacterium]